jgi:KaiC/GvpD/RAD55 family RecA-like ATPase
MKESKNDIPLDSNQDKLVYTVTELMALGSIKQKYLMKPILPQKGCAVLAGKPDTGKSQFARQLCIQIALDNNKFLGFDLTPTRKKALYVATEDDIDSIKFLTNKQFIGLDKPFNDNLRFIFADVLTQKEIFNILKKELAKEPVALVVVDSFGDIFKNSDSNNNMAMRNTVKDFDRLAKKYDCLVLFVHHINKGGYRQSPGQEHIQGGSGLVQKVRLALQLSEGDGDIRYLSVVKGNYCPKQYKSNSLELLFSEQTFLFKNTGNILPTSEIGFTSGNKGADKKLERLEETAKKILGKELIAHNIFVDRFITLTGKSLPTANRRLKDLCKAGIIEKYNNKYRLKAEVSEEDNSIDDSEEAKKITS